VLNRLESSKFLKHKFARIYDRNLFRGAESLSGRGSDLDQTRTIEVEIPVILRELQIRSLLDVPCGDQNWIRRIDLTGIQYLGADIVSALVEKNNKNFSSEGKKYIELDLTLTVPPKADLVFCRDLFVHLTTNSIRQCLENIKLSGSTYLLTTTFTNSRTYKNLPIFTRGVGWRPINLQLEPFFLPPPIKIINEKCTEVGGRFADKSLGLWRITDL
jgi:hypothetical protein